MIKRILLIIIGFMFTYLATGQERPLVAGMRITKSMKVKKGVYVLPATADITKSVIVIEGNDIVVDFNSATLKGNATKKNPDQFTGVAIMIKGGKNITVKNLVAKGYKVALYAMNIEDLRLEDCDFSYNYRPKLNSTQEKEDISDWMSYHKNEKDEWLRYGAAIYLKDCDSAKITGCRVTGGQNALMMMRCNNNQVISNDFSFNSGIGIGMYRSNGNQIRNNRIIFNVRGYSHGVYNRGQDSAGILVYEQSSNNLFHRNNVTHSGDGFFLWAGQTTMDSGIGGCNDNILSGNDFSYAPTNGIEVTFSRNIIHNNRMFECDHGIWGGYSYHTLIFGNRFQDNRIAIAIEHGQHNEIVNNLFINDKEAIRLWARKTQPSDWGYARYRDTRSIDYSIAANSFNGNPTVFNLSRTDSILFVNNSFSGNGIIYKLDSTVSNIDTTGSKDLASDTLPGYRDNSYDPFKPFAGASKIAGRKNIRITEWGPYDFRYPIIWNNNPTDTTGLMKFDILGPAGKWVIKSFKGVESLSAKSGTFPASITAKKQKALNTDITIELEYVGEAFTTVFGDKVPARTAHRFYFRKYFQPINWQVQFYALDTTLHNPITTGSLFSPVELKVPFLTEKKDRLEYAWWGGIKAGEHQHKQFMTVANATVTMKPGQYELSVTWDDAVRIFIDGKLVLNEWQPSRYTFDESPNKKLIVTFNGKHQLRVEHVELGGFATLALKLKKLY